MTTAIPKRKTLPAKELARYACNDCGVNVVEIGEFYMLKPQIWQDQLGLGWDDNLCVGCLEARLGRKIAGFWDMGSIPSYPWMRPMSERLADRFGLIKGKNGKLRKKTKREPRR